MNNTVVVVPAITRTACPFYGFSAMKKLKTLTDSYGNQCSLIGYEHSPCKMEMTGESPNWKRCPHFNHEGNRERIAYALDNWRISPEEMRPAHALDWQGISLRIWFQLIMMRGH